MRNINLQVIISLSLLLWSTNLKAQNLCPPDQPCPGNQCYDLTENEAMDIMTAQLSVLGDPPNTWVVDKIGHGLICLDYCQPGSLMVSPGKLTKGKCTYRVTNNDPVNMMGDCTTIVLKQKVQ